MFVMTMDQRGSSSGPDRVADLVDGLNAEGTDRGIVRPFQRTAGDEVQGLLDRADAVVGIALSAARSGHWSVGIGVGPVREPMPRETRAGAGPAFENAREAVERAKHSPGRVAVSAPPSVSRPAEAGVQAGGGDRAGLLEAVEASLQLLAELEYRRSDEGQDAGRLMDAGLTQREAAERLGITQQAVSSRLRSGLWHETRRLAAVAAGQLEGLDARLAVDRSAPGGVR
jgi:Winged helix-turn-helix DNA-binding